MMTKVDAIADENIPQSSPSCVKLDPELFDPQGNSSQHEEELVPLPKEASSSGANWIDIDFDWERGIQAVVAPFRRHDHSFRVEVESRLHHSFGDLEWLEQTNTLAVDLELKLRVGYAMMNAVHRPKSAPSSPSTDALDHPNPKIKRSKSFETVTRAPITPKQDPFHGMASPNSNPKKVTKRSKSAEDLGKMSRAIKKEKSEKRGKGSNEQLGCHGMMEELRKKWADRTKTPRRSSDTMIARDMLRPMLTPSPRSRPSRDALSVSEHCAHRLPGGDESLSSSSEHGTSRSKNIPPTTRKAGPLRGVTRHRSSESLLRPMDEDGSSLSRDALSVSEHCAPRLPGGDESLSSSSEHERSRSKNIQPTTRKAGPLRGVTRHRSSESLLGSSFTTKRSNSCGDFVIDTQPSSFRQANATFVGKTQGRSSLIRAHQQKQNIIDKRRAEVRKSLFQCFDDELDQDFLDFVKGAPSTNPAAPPAASPLSVMIHK